MERNTQQRTRKQRLIQKAQMLGIEGAEQMTERQLKEELRRIGGGPDLRRFNAPPKRVTREAIAEKLIAHVTEEVEVAEKGADGEKHTVRKPRLLAILDVLARRAIRKGDVSAAKEYLDRTIGKARAHDRVDVGFAVGGLTPEEEQAVERLARILRGETD